MMPMKNGMAVYLPVKMSSILRLLACSLLLTFGVRTDGNISAANRSNSNGAGGDGWFKTDNFRIQKIGYVPADAIAVYDHYVNILQEYNSQREPMSATVADELEEKVGQLGSMTEKDNFEDIVAGILDAKDILATAFARR